ncbi:AzlC family ABC transporter permease [Kiloniella sp.]|uniref:AzlC family ABC transporter permease n=1 Tax=Kiloniella sp. TaxID=1938587 RepID=UPI003A8D3461
MSGQTYTDEIPSGDMQPENIEARSIPSGIISGENSTKTVPNPVMASDIKDGIKDVLPILIAIVPFAAVFGAVAIESGLSFGETMVTSLSIYAAASQYVMIDLMGQSVPVWSIVLAVFAVNFRHVLYSASIGRTMGTFSFWQKALAFFLLVDPQFASSEARASKSGLRPAYYFSYALMIYGTWMAANAIGALFGSLISSPATYGLDFILPLYFTGLVAGFHKRPNFVLILITSAGVSLAAYLTIGSPWHITLGGIAGLIIAAALSKPQDTSPQDMNKHKAVSTPKESTANV